MLIIGSDLPFKIRNMPIIATAVAVLCLALVGVAALEPSYGQAAIGQVPETVADAAFVNATRNDAASATSGSAGEDAEPLTFRAEFTGPRTIKLKPSDGLPEQTLTKTSFTVTMPDGDDANSEPDAVALAKSPDKPGNWIVILTLSEDAAEGVVYTVTPSASVLGHGNVAYAAGGIDLMYTPDTTPPELTAVFANARTITIMASEDLNYEEFKTSSFAVTVPDGDDADELPDTVTVSSHTYDPRLTVTPSFIYITLAADATKHVEHTVTLPSSVTDVNGVPYSGDALTAEHNPVKVPPTDRTPPWFHATFLDARSIILKASEPLSHPGYTNDRFVVTVPDVDDADAQHEQVPVVVGRMDYGLTPTIVWLRLVTGAAEGVPHIITPSTEVTDANGVAFGGAPLVATYVATDRTPPTVTGAAFADSTHIDVTFSEPVTAGGVWTVTPSLGTVTAAQGSSASIVRLEVTTAATDGTAYTIDVPTQVADRAATPNTLAASTTASATYTAPGTAPPTIYSAALTSSKTVTVTMSEAVSGTLNAADWAVGSSTFDSGAVSAGGTAITLTRQAGVFSPTSTALPAGAALSYTGSSLADTDGNALAAVSGSAAIALIDSAPPTFTARTHNSTIAVVTFSEPVSGVTTFSEWSVDGDLPYPPLNYLRFYPSEYYPLLPHNDLTRPLELTSKILLDVYRSGWWRANSEPTVTFTPRPETATTPALVDQAGNRMAADGATVSVTATDGTSPSLTRAFFHGPRTITLTSSEPLDAATVTDTALVVTVPGTTHTDSIHWYSYDIVPLATRDDSANPPVVPVAYTAGSTTITLTLAADAVAGVHHVIRPSSSMTDVNGVGFSRLGTGAADTYYDSSPPGASIMTVTVADTVSGAFTDRTGEGGHYANAGDGVRIDVTFDEYVSGPPTITVPGEHRTPTATAMSTNGASYARSWYHWFAVSADDNGAALEFEITATDRQSVPNTGTLTQEEITAGNNAIIDVTAPVLSGDAAFSGTNLVVTFSEDILPASLGITATLPDLKTHTITATASGAALTVPLGEHAAETGTYSVAIPASVTDRAGNARASSAAAASATYTAPSTTPLPSTTPPSDTTPPTFTAAFTDARTIVLTASEALDADTVTTSRFAVTVPDGDDADSLPDAVEVTSLSSSLVPDTRVLTIRIGTPATPGVVHTITPSSSVTDAAGVAYAAGAITATYTTTGTPAPAPDTTPPTITRAEFFHRQIMDLWFSEPLDPSTVTLDNFVVTVPDGDDADTLPDPVQPTSWIRYTPYKDGSSRVEFGISPRAAIGVVHTITPTTGLTDANGVAYAAGGVTATYTTSDTTPPTFTAEFRGSQTILLRPSESLVESTTGHANFAVTVPDGDDADSEPDAVALVPSPYPLDNTLVRLRLAVDAAKDVIHTITPSTSVADDNGVAYAGGSVTATYTPDTTPPTFVAAFTDARKITLTATEHLHPVSLRGANFAVTVPDGDDADSLPDIVPADGLAYIALRSIAPSLLEISLHSDAAEGVEHTITLPTSITDSNGVPYGGAPLVATYTAPKVPPADTTPPTFTAEFLDARSIILSASEPLSTSAFRAADFPVTVLDGDDADTLPDPVPMAYFPISTRLAPTQVLLSLADAATAGVPYTVTPSTSVTDANGVPYAAGGVTATYTAPDVTTPASDTLSLNASFVQRFTILLILTKSLDPDTVTPANFAVTVPDGDDADSLPDPVQVTRVRYEPHNAATPAVWLTIDPGAVVGVEHTITPSTAVTDVHGMAYAAGAVTATHTSRPGETPPTFTAAFTNARTIVLTASEYLDHRKITPANFAVTVPADTNSPDGTGTSVNTIALASYSPVAHTIGETTVTIRLAADAAEGVVHTVTPSSSVTDFRGLRYEAGGVTATYTAPDTTPPTFTAAFTDARTIVLTASEAIDSDTITPSRFAVTVPDGDDSDSEPDAVLVSSLLRSPVPDTLTVTIGIAPPATPGVVYTITPSSLVTDSAGVAYAAGGVSATYTTTGTTPPPSTTPQPSTTPPPDTTAPMATEAAHVWPGRIEVTFDEAIKGTTALSEWTIAGAHPDNMHGPPLGNYDHDDDTGIFTIRDPGITKLVLFYPLDTWQASRVTDATSEITYTRSTGNVANALTDTATPTPNALESIPAGALTAVDRTPPLRLSAAFVSSTAIDVTFSEPVTNGGEWTISPSLGALSAVTPSPSSNIIRLATTTPASPGTEYTLTMPSQVRDNSPARNGAVGYPISNVVTESLTYTAPVTAPADTTPPTFTAAFRDARSIVLTASEALDANTVTTARFAVTVPDGDDADSLPDAVEVAYLSISLAPETKVLTIGIGTPAADGVVHTITPSSSVTDANGVAYAAGAITATYTTTDTPPTISSAALTSSSTVLVTMSAPVSGTVTGSEWSLNIGDGVTFDGGSVGVTPRFSSTLDNTKIALTLDADNALSSTAVAAGTTLTYGGAGSILAGTAPLATGASVALTDEAPPTFMAQVNDGAQVGITFSEPVRMLLGASPSVFDFNYHTRADTIYCSISGVLGYFPDPRCDGGEPVFPTSHTFDATAQTATLQFGGTVSATDNSYAEYFGIKCDSRPACAATMEAGDKLLVTSMPAMVYSPSSQHLPSQYPITKYEDLHGNAMLNMTAVAAATDNASPVARAEFADADTITVTLSEEMATPSPEVLGGITVTKSASPVTISGTPSFTAHTAATADEGFVRPAIEITLASDALSGEYSISFPSGLVAAGGPADKRTVAAASATYTATDTTPPTFTAAFTDARTIVLTASEALDPDTVTTSRFAVTVSDGDDADSLPDAVEITSLSRPLVPDTSVLTIRIGTPATDGVVHTITPSTSVTDAAGVAYAAGAITATYTAPVTTPMPSTPPPSDTTPPTFTAAFTDARTIVLTASEALDADTVTSSRFAVTVPDGDDADSLPDAVEVASLSRPLVPETRVLTIHLGTPAADGVVHTITPSSSVTDAAGVAYAAGAITATYTAPPGTTAPTASGATHLWPGLVHVEFDKKIRGTTAISEWAVDGTTVTLVGWPRGDYVFGEGTLTIGEPGIDTILLAYTPASWTDTGATPSVTYTKLTGNDAPALTDAASPASVVASIAAGELVAVDRAPPKPLSAAFASSRTLDVTFGEPVTTGGTWTVSPSLGAVTAAEGSSTDVIRLTLEEPASNGASYTIGVPTQVVDRADATNSVVASTAMRATYTSPDTEPPEASSLTVTVADDVSGTFIDRSGEGARYATAGDRITIAVTFDENVTGVPMITVPGDHRTATAAAMGNAGDADAATWSHSFTVSADDDEAALEFSITAVDEAANSGETTHAGLAEGTNAIIDVTAPTLASPDPAFSDTDMVITFSEGIALPASELAVTLPGGETAQAEATASGTAITVRVGSHATVTGTYSVAIPETVVDIAGNSRAASAATASAAYTVPDTTPPTFTAAFTDARTIVLTASEALDPDTVTSSRFAITVPDGDDADSAPDAVEVAYLSRPLVPDTRVLTIGIDTPATDGVVHTITPSSSVTDANGVAYAAGSITATYASPADTTAPTASGATHLWPGLVHVEFDEAIMGKTAVRAWAVDGATATLVGWPHGSYAYGDGTLTINDPGVTTLLLAFTPASWADTGVTPSVTYERPSGGAMELTDAAAAPNALEAIPTGALIAVDAAPPRAQSAAFASATTIDVTFGEPVTTGGAWSVSPSLGEVSAAEGSSTDVIRLTLASPAADGSTYTIRVPEQIVDRAATPNSVAVSSAVRATYTAPDTEPPAALSLTVMVADDISDTFIDRSGEGAGYATAGDRITIAATFDEDIVGTPTITLDGRGVTDAAMAQGATVRVWSYAHTVASNDDESTFGFAITAADEAANSGETTHAGLAEGTNAIIDVTAPTLASPDPAFSETDMVVTFSEGVALPVSELAVTLPGGETAQAEAAASGATLTVRVGAHATVTGTYSVAIPETLVDRAGNARAASAGTASAAYVVPDTTPPTFTAEFTDARTIVLTASEALDADTVTSSRFAITVPDGDDADSAPDAVEVAYLSSSLVPETRVLTIGIGTPATAGVVHTITPSTYVTDANGVAYAAGSITATYASLADTTAPTASGATHLWPGLVHVEFDEAIMGKTAVRAWAVDGATATLVGWPHGSYAYGDGTLTINDPGVTTLLLAFTPASWADTGVTPSVTYERPSGGAMELTDAAAAPNALEAIPTGALIAVDAAPPRAQSAAFVSATTLDVTFGEPVTTGGAWSVSPSLGEVSAAEGTSTDVIRLTLAAPAADGSTYTIRVPEQIVDRAPVPNAITVSSAVRATYTAPVTTPTDTTAPTFTARTINSTAAIVTFSEPVTGVTAYSEWTVGGYLATAPPLHGESGDQARELDSATSLVLHVGSGGSWPTDAQPIVTFTPLEATAEAPALADSSGNRVAADDETVSVTAADGAPPLLSGMSFGDQRTITITASEALDEATVTAANLAVTVPDGDDAGSEPDAVTLATVAYTAGETTLTLTLAADAAGSTVHTITPSASITDAAGVAYGGEPLRATAPYVADLTFRAGHTGAIDDTVMRVTFSEPFAAAGASLPAASEWTISGTVRATGSPTTLTPSAVSYDESAGTAELTLPIGRFAYSGLIGGGTITLSISEDAALSIVTLAATPAALANTHATVEDTQGPAFTAKARGDMTFVRFDEPVTGATGAGDWTVTEDGADIEVFGVYPTHLDKSPGPPATTPETAAGASGLRPVVEPPALQVTEPVKLLTLVHARLASDASTPTVAYAPVGDSPLSDFGGSAAPADTRVAIDGKPPEALSARFVAADVIRVDFSEAVNEPPNLTILATLEPELNVSIVGHDEGNAVRSTPPGGIADSRLTFTLASDATPGKSYELSFSTRLKDQADSPNHWNTVNRAHATNGHTPVVLTVPETAPGEEEVPEAAAEIAQETTPEAAQEEPAEAPPETTPEAAAEPEELSDRPAVAPEDSAGAAQEATPEPEATPDTTPPTFTAAFTDARTIVLTASEALDPDTVTSSRFAVTVPDGDDADSLPDAVEVASLSRPLVPETRVLTIHLGTPAADGVVHTITPSSSVTDAAGVAYAAGAITATYTAPTASGATHLWPGLVHVEFDKKIRGTTAISEWAVDGTTVTLVGWPRGDYVFGEGTLTIGEPGIDTILLAYTPASWTDTGATPSVTYTKLTGNDAPALTDAASPASVVASIAAGELVAVDRAPPKPLSAAFASSRTLDVTFGEPVTTGGTWTVSPSLGAVTAAEGSSTDVIRLTLAAPATDGSTYTVSVPEQVVDRATPPNSVTLLSPITATYTAPDTTAPTFTAKTLNSTAAIVTFDEPVTGVTAYSEWTVGGHLATAPPLHGESGDQARELDSATSLVLNVGSNGSWGTGAQPTVAFTPRSATAEAPALADSSGNRVAADDQTVSVTAADGAPPILSGMSFGDQRTITITASEALDAATVTVDNLAVTVPDGDDAGSEPDAVALATVAYTAGETTLTLTLAADAAGSTVHTATPSDSLTDAAGVAYGGAPLSATAPYVADLTFRAGHTGLISDTVMHVTFSEPFAAAAGASLPAADAWTISGTVKATGSPMTLTPSAVSYDESAGTAELTLSIGRFAAYSGLIGGGTITLSISEDAALSIVTLAATPAALANTHATVEDTRGSAFTAKARGDMTFVRFDEPVRGTTGAGDWTVTEDGANIEVFGVYLTPETAAGASGLRPEVRPPALQVTEPVKILILVHARLASDASTPTVAYAPVGDSSLSDFGGSAAPADTRVAIDGKPPEALSVSFVEADVIMVDFSEAVNEPPNLTILATLEPELNVSIVGHDEGNAVRSTPPGGIADSRLTFTLASGATPGESYELSFSTRLTDQADSPNYWNTVNRAHATYGSTLVASTSPETAPEEDDVPEAAAEAAQEEPQEATPETTPEAAAEPEELSDRPAATPEDAAGAAQEATPEPEATPETPDTTQEEPQAPAPEATRQTAPEPEELSDRPAATPEDAAGAAQEATPEATVAFTARTLDSTAVIITFGEPVTGTTAYSEWIVGGNTATAPQARELDSATSLTLDIDSSGSWGTGAQPTVAFTPRPATAEAPALVGSSGNRVAADGQTVSVTAADGVPPLVQALTVAVLDGGVSGTVKTGDQAGIADAGDAVMVTLIQSEPASQASPPTLTALGSSITMALSDSGETATGAIAVPESWASDGPLEFGIETTDAAGTPNAATFGHADLTGDNVRIDTNAPTIVSAIRLSPSFVQLFFSENVRGTGSVSVSPDAGTGSPVPLSIHAAPEPRYATATLALAGTEYTFTIDSTFTDLTGKAFTPQAVTVKDNDGSFDIGVLVVPPDADEPITLAPVDEGGRPAPELRILADELDGAGEDNTFESSVTAFIEGVTLTVQADTAIRDLGPTDAGATAGTLLMELASRGVGVEHVAATNALDESAQRDNERVAEALNAQEPTILVTLGKADDTEPVLFSKPVSVRLDGAAGSDYVFYIAGAPDTGRAGATAIPTCEEAGYPGASAEAAPQMPDARVAAMAAECYVTDYPDIVIWTTHFTQFGATQGAGAGSSSDCDDCTAPTLGVDSSGTRRVSGGFAYNGDAIDSAYYYTPLPLITVETGVENVATLKVFEDSGAHNVRHVGLGFGLSRGQHFAESEAEIRVSLPYSGEPTVSLDDPANAIDFESLRAESATGECMAGSTSECRIVTIYHTFREPLDFNVVSTIVWDDRRNAWQNFFNHGVHVTGDSLNPRHGIEVNGGELVLYPLIAGTVDEDGDGIYDHDERHMTIMLDENRNVYRLSPDGTYRTLSNLYALHHEIDDAMYDDDRARLHGVDRSSPDFGEELARQEAIAMRIMEEMGISIAPREMRAAAPSPLEDWVIEPRLDALGDEIARELEIAERILDSLSPELARAR